MTPTERLLAGTKELWAKYLEHPFVQGIADGTLAHEKFQYYMIQDYLYLIDYAKVFALGAVKARDLEAMQLFAGYVGRIFNGEMDIHKTYMKRLGISLSDVEQTKIALDNRSYTAYMLSVAFNEGPAEIVASILSCAVSYEYIARNLLKQHPDADRHPFYGEWVSGYASEGYHEANLKLIALMDRLAKDYTEEQLLHLEEIFYECSRYEMAFWDMAWEMKT